MNEEKYIKISMTDLNDLLSKKPNDVTTKTILPQQLQSVDVHHTNNANASINNTNASINKRTIMPMFIRSALHSLMTFIVIVILLISSKPKCLFTNTYCPKFKPIQIGQYKLSLVHFIIVIAILCCVID